MMRFEGEEINGYTLSVKAFRGDSETPLSRGERLEMSCVVEVVEVSIRENLKTGQVFRDHILKIEEVDLG